MTPAVFKIEPTTQQYDWGNVGTNSLVARLAAASGATIDESAPYAELWMGTHTKSPSHLHGTATSLSSHLESHPNLVGKPVLSTFPDPGLPFLFKVLSIRTALSIQSHPDEATAKVLHATSPDIYKDPNHKPEMTIALTRFTAMCGFRPLSQIAAALESTPELAEFVPESIRSRFIKLARAVSTTSGTTDHPAEKAALKDVFSAVISAPPDVYQPRVAALVSRYKAGTINPAEDPVRVNLVQTLNSQYPSDIGVFCAFLLNYVEMQPGDAMFLGAGEPHAYVSGECIECMANSDNVIRAGLTPKFRDIPNLVAGLTYVAAPVSTHGVRGEPFAGSDTSTGTSTLYDPPIREFSVVRTALRSETAGESPHAHRPVAGPSLLLVTQGAGVVRWGSGGTDEEKMDIAAGDVFFVGTEQGIQFEVRPGADGDTDGLVLYRAFVEV